MNETPPYDYCRSASRFRIIRVYAVASVLVVGVASALFVSAVNDDRARLASTYQATVLESSRPLADDVVKAPADWTGDGDADGWAFGEYLPGDTAPVFVTADGESYRPNDTVDYVLFGVFMSFVVVLGAGFAGFAFYPALYRRAERAATRDWEQARALVVDPGAPPRQSWR